MAQLVGAVLVTVILVGFAMANAHHVELSCVFGSPFRVRLIFLLGVAYAAGLLTAWFQRMLRNAAREAEQRRVQRMMRRVAIQRVEADAE